MLTKCEDTWRSKYEKMRHHVKGRRSIGGQPDHSPYTICETLEEEKHQGFNQRDKGFTVRTKEKQNWKPHHQYSDMGYFLTLLSLRRTIINNYLWTRYHWENINNMEVRLKPPPPGQHQGQDTKH